MQRIIGALTLLVLACGSALAQGYPSRTASLVVPANPGGPTDALARVLAEKLQEHYGQPFIVENRGGANGAIGAMAVARAQPDGHTILISVDGPVLVNPALNPKVGYEPMKDFEPVAIVGDGGDVVLAVHADSPVNSVRELAELMRKDPSKANYVSSGAGFPSHIVAELLKREAKFNAQHIPMRGAGAAMQELLSGRMSFSFPPVSLAVAYATSGKIKLLAIASEKRNSQIPDVPTFAELGLPNVTPPGYWIATYVPAGTPAPIVKDLATQIRRITRSQEYEPLLKRQGLFSSSSSPEEIVARMKRELQFWKGTIEKLDIRPE